LEDEKQERSTSLTIAPLRRSSGKELTNYLLFTGEKENREYAAFIGAA
jgi:hypothetical protein